MKKSISVVPYAVIAPLGVLLTLGCALLPRLLAGSVYAAAFGTAYLAAFQVLNRLPLHFYIVTLAALPLLVSGIVAAITRKKSKVRWIVFAICTVVYILLLAAGYVLDTIFAPQAAMFYLKAPAELLDWYIDLDSMGLIGTGIAAFVIFLFTHFCMLPRIHSAAKFVGFGLFALLSLVLSWLLLPVLLFTLDMPAMALLAPAAATLLAAIPAGLVLLLMGLLMKPKKHAAPAHGPAVTDDTPALKTQPVAPPPAPAAETPAAVPPAPVAPPAPAPAEEKEPADIPYEQGMILYAKEMNWEAHGPNDWESTVYKVYRNGAVFSKANYGPYHPAYLLPNTQVCRLNQEGCTELSALLRNFLTLEAHRNGCDGIGWQLVGFSAQGEVRHQTTGYVYGVEGLENLTRFLVADCQQYQAASSAQAQN